MFTRIALLVATLSLGAPSTLPAQKLAPRSFAISPPVAGKTTWNLDTDGPLDLGTSGSWKIIPQSTFDATAKMWGAGGGAAFSGGGAGGGGGYSTGSITFRVGAVYTILVGAGGQASVVTARGGDGGFGGGGAGGGVQPPGEGGPGAQFSMGGAGRQGGGFLAGGTGGRIVVSAPQQ